MWIITTTIYVCLNFAGYPIHSTSSDFDDFFLLSRAAAFIGIFVPHGLNSVFEFFLSPLYLLSLPISLGTMAVSHKYIAKKDLPTPKKILRYFIVIIGVTAIADLFLGAPFASWIIFFYGKGKQ